jgi:hypothetical protein
MNKSTKGFIVFLCLFTLSLFLIFMSGSYKELQDELQTFAFIPGTASVWALIISLLAFGENN